MCNYFSSLVKKRAGWLIILLGEMFIATAMGHFNMNWKRL